MRPGATIILDDAPCRKSKAVRKLVEGADGAVELIFLPAHASNLNPMEVLRRVPKRAQHGWYFASVVWLEATVT